jgi:hypothetical protein
MNAKTTLLRRGLFLGFFCSSQAMKTARAAHAAEMGILYTCKLKKIRTARVPREPLKWASQKCPYIVALHRHEWNENLLDHTSVYAFRIAISTTFAISACRFLETIQLICELTRKYSECFS